MKLSNNLKSQLNWNITKWEQNMYLLIINTDIHIADWKELDTVCLQCTFVPIGETLLFL